MRFGAATVALPARNVLAAGIGCTTGHWPLMFSRILPAYTESFAGIILISLTFAYLVLISCFFIVLAL